MYLQFLSILVYAAFSTSISFAKPPKVPPKEGEIGEFFWRPATMEVVKLLKNSMNESVNPCDNFYEFACGNYGKKSNYSPTTAIEEELKAHVKDLLVNTMSDATNSKVVNSTRQLMQGCLKYKRTATLNDLYEILTGVYSNNSLKDLFFLLARQGIQTSFRSVLTQLPSNDHVIGLDHPNDEFADPKKRPSSSHWIDTIINNDTLATGVMEYAMKIALLTTQPEGMSTYKPVWIDIERISNDMDPDFWSANKVLYGDYFEKLDNLITETGETVVRAHTLMKATYAAAILTSDGILDSVEDTCVRFISEHFPIVVKSMMAQEYVGEELRDGVKELFDNMLDSTEETLRAQEWLGSSRETAIKKVRKGDIWIDLPEELHNYTALDSYFQDFNVSEYENFEIDFWNVLEFKQSEMVATLKKHKVHVHMHMMKKNFPVGATQAGNLHGQDLTIYSTAMLQSPWFYHRFPAFFRYGLLGSVFGHEYGHGLANNKIPGPYFTEGGRVSEATKEEFGKRAQCLIDQFDNDTVVSIEGIEYKVSGKQNLNENIADNSGFHIAFQAYKKFMTNVKRPKRMQELGKYSTDQMFFVSTAQFFCAVVNEELVKTFPNDKHAPDPVRVNSFRNSDDFAKAFKCPVGSKMNPLKKCRLWD